MQLGTLSHSRAAQASLPSLCPLWPQVHEDYACTLNQTNIGSNNNKFYIIQLLEEGDRFACWNRWGRVGEVGQSKLSYFVLLEDAKKRTLRRSFGTRPRTAGWIGTILWPTRASTCLLKYGERTRPRKPW